MQIKSAAAAPLYPQPIPVWSAIIISLYHVVKHVMRLHNLPVCSIHHTQAAPR